MSEHWTDRLSEYMDGDLPQEQAKRLELHLSECPSCAGALGELRALVASASMLPDSPPERDLWPEIEARLTPRTAAGVERTVIPMATRTPPTRRRLAFTIPQLVAAGIALVALSAGGAWMARGGAAVQPAAVAAGAPVADPGTGAPAGSTILTSSWDAAVADLETEFARRRADLDPATIQVVERNLAIIDGAILEARRALEADPASEFLNGYVAEAMQRKVDLLRQATRIQRTES